MRKLVLVPHNRGSGSVRELANLLSAKLGYKVFRVTPDKVRNRVGFVIREGTGKLNQFRAFEAGGVSTPEYTTDRNVAAAWLPDNLVVCRTLLRSSEGKGIVIAETADQIVTAPLYTKYFKKKKEFRVHVFNGQVIDVQEKRKKSGVDERDTRVRNLANGYVFCRTDLVEPTGLRDLAVRACTVLGYVFGAVDIAYNQHHNQCVVLEVNANPGMQGTTLEKYSNAVINWYRNQL